MPKFVIERQYLVPMYQHTPSKTEVRLRTGGKVREQSPERPVGTRATAALRGLFRLNGEAPRHAYSSGNNLDLADTRKFCVLNEEAGELHPSRPEHSKHASHSAAPWLRNLCERPSKATVRTRLPLEWAVSSSEPRLT